MFDSFDKKRFVLSLTLYELKDKESGFAGAPEVVSAHDMTFTYRHKAIQDVVDRGVPLWQAKAEMLRNMQEFFIHDFPEAISSMLADVSVSFCGDDIPPPTKDRVRQ